LLAVPSEVERWRRFLDRCHDHRGCDGEPIASTNPLEHSMFAKEEGPDRFTDREAAEALENWRGRPLIRV